MLRCAYFSEELEQLMTDGVTMETVKDGHSVVCSASHLTAFSVIAYDSQPVSLSLYTGVCVCGVCVCMHAFVCKDCGLHWDISLNSYIFVARFTEFLLYT